MKTYGAPPGPSVAMYDTILDAIASSADQFSNHASLARYIFERVHLRHQQDGGPNANNVFSMPTAQTYNAVIRACAEQSFDDQNDEKIRDEAIDTAFLAYDAIGQSQHVRRNSSTYAHLLRVVAKFIPPSLSRGNIAYGLWKNATSEDNVLDGAILQAYLEANRRGGSNGAEFDEWASQLEAHGIEQGSKIPQKWWKNRGIRRMDLHGVGGGTY